MSKKFIPSNGTEGLMFQEEWCRRCKRDQAFQRGEGEGCQILADTYAHWPDENKFPSEWTYNDKSEAICTAFEAAPDGKE